MIAVQTVSTKKLMTNPFRHQLMMYWSHSVASISRFYDVILITDTKGAELVKTYGLPYKKVYTYLNSLSEDNIKHLQSFIKFHYLDRLTEDFIQFDWDVFIYEKLKNFDNFIFQSDEGKCYSCFDFNLLNIKLPYDSLVNSINTGTFGMKQTHMRIFQEYKLYVLAHIDNVVPLHRSSTIPHLIYDATSFVEETYIVKLCEKYKLKYDTVIERDYDKVQRHRFFSTKERMVNFNDQYDNTTFNLLDKNFPYYHLIGYHKNNLDHAQRANIRFREEFPESFDRTVNLLSKGK
jgi:hypothetical protein